MAYQAIALGTTADDGTGDSLRVGADKVNDNFVELYTLLGTGSALSSGISSSATVVTLASPVFTGTVTLPGVQAFSDGSVSAPSITNTGDTNTGIYFSEADSVDFTTGGTRRLKIDSSGVDVTGLLTSSAGATITGTLTASDTAIVATNGITPAGANGAALGSASLEWSDLYLASGAVIALGNSQDVTLTHVGGTGLLLNSTNVIQFNDASQNIGAPSATVLDINATDEIELNATLVDINANLDVSGTYTGAGTMTTGGNISIPDAGYIGSVSDTDAIQIEADGDIVFSQDVAISGTLGVTGVVTANAGVVVDNFTLDGTTLALSSGDMTLDVAGDIVLDADGAQVRFKDAGTERFIFNLDATPELDVAGGHFTIHQTTSDADILFTGNDGGSAITALTLDMSAAGAATFNSTIAATPTSTTLIKNSAGSTLKTIYGIAST
jgi:hypothetical protein